MIPFLLAGCDAGDAEQRRQRLHLPSEDFVASAEIGKNLFRQQCSRCHGVDARGTNQGPPLIHKTYESSHHADLAFRMAVKKGVRQHHWQFGDMPPMEGIGPEDTGHMIAFIRQEQKRVGIR